MAKIFSNSIATPFSDIDEMMDMYKYYIETSTYLKLDISYIDYDILRNRNKLMKSVFENLPKLFKTNNKELRDYFNNVESDLDYLLMLYTQLSNRKGDIRKKIDSIVCSSTNSLDDIINALDNKYNIQDMDTPITIEEIRESDILWEDTENNKFFIRINELDDLIRLGRTAYWCHTYDNAYNNYIRYTYNGVTFIFIEGLDSKQEVNVVNVDMLSFYLNDNDEFRRRLEDYENEDKEDENEEEEYIYTFENFPMYRPFSYIRKFFGEESIDKIMSLFDEF